MPQTITPLVSIAKANSDRKVDTVQAFRECMQKHGITYETLASLWGVSKSRAYTTLRSSSAVQWRRLDQMPAAFLVDFFARLQAQAEAIVPQYRTRGVVAECVDVGIAYGRLLDVAAEAAADGHVDDSERAAIHSAAEAVTREVRDVARAAS